MTTGPISVLSLIKGLGTGGAESLLVASARVRDRSAVSMEVAYLLPWKDSMVSALEAAGVRVECYQVRDERDLRWTLRLRRRLRDRPVDVVHVHSPYVAAMTRVIVRSLPRATRPVLVTTEHNAWNTFHPLTRYANRWTASQDFTTIAVTEEVRRSMGKRATASESLVHGVDLEAIRALRDERDEVRRELGFDETTIVVGTVANYHRKKDWPTLLRAARVIADRGLPIRFVAVGQGPLEAEVTTMHRELGLDGVVLLTGRRLDAVRLMAGTDIFVLATLWEGLPVAVMEAAALGLPIIASAVGGLPEAFTDGEDAVLVPPSDPGALADAIERLASDPDTRRALAQAAVVRSPEFGAARAQRRIEDIYRQATRAR